jgi:hypothetical protein
MVKTDLNQRYIAIKQYNADGEFVGPVLIEPKVAGMIGNELCALYIRNDQT